MTVIPRTLLQLLFLSLVISFALGINYLLAWTGPTGTAPNNNTAAPINVSTTAQSKDAAFALFDNFYAQGIGVNVSPPTHSLTLGPTANGITTGIKFSDGTVQTTALTGTGGSISSSGSLAVNTSRVIPITSNSLFINIFGGYNGSDQAQSGGFIVKDSGVWKAYFTGGELSTSFNLSTTEQCLMVTATLPIICATINAGATTITLRVGHAFPVQYFLFNK